MRTLLFLAAVAIAAAITFAVMFSSDDADSDSEAEASVRHTVRGDSSEFSLREDGLTIKADWRGKLKLDESGDAIAYVEDYLAIEIEENDARESVRLEKDGRKIETAYWRDGNEQAPGEDTEAHVSDLIIRFLRASGFEADMRVKKILKEGGVDAVLAEIDQLSSNYAIRRYAAALSEHESLSTDQVAQLIDKLLHLNGDHEIARALFAIAENQDINDEAVGALLAVAEKIGSDYEKRRVLTVLSARPLSDAAADKTVALIETIESDYDIRVSIEAFLSRDEIEPGHVAQLLETAADEVESDHDLRLILTKAAPHLDKPSLANTWLEAFDELESDYDKRVALESAAVRAESNESLTARLREAAQSIESDYERERALKAFE